MSKIQAGQVIRGPRWPEPVELNLVEDLGEYIHLVGATTGTTADVDFKTTKPCFTTAYSHVNLVAADTARWEQSAAFRLEQAVLLGSVQFYARNEQLGFSIPYDYLKVSHHYEPDYLVRLRNGVTVVLEIKGMETEQDRAKHQAAERWTAAVNNWGELGQWRFHVCKDPQMLGQELAYLVKVTGG